MKSAQKMLVVGLAWVLVAVVFTVGVAVGGALEGGRVPVGQDLRHTSIVVGDAVCYVFEAGQTMSVDCVWPK